MKLKIRPLATRHKGLILILIAVIILVLGLVVTNRAMRSAEAACNQYAVEKMRLAGLPGDSYSSGVFNESVEDAGDFAIAFEAIERVAPQDIQGDMANLATAYSIIDNDPSKAVSVSINAIQAEETVEKWIQANCK